MLTSRIITGNKLRLSCFENVPNIPTPHHLRDQLYHNKTKLLVDLAHIRAWNEQVADLLETKPTEVLPLVRSFCFAMNRFSPCLGW